MLGISIVLVSSTFNGNWIPKNHSILTSYKYCIYIASHNFINCSALKREMKGANESRLMVKKQLIALTQLANSDNNIDERELKLIFRIGEAHGMEKEDIQAIIDNPGSLGDLKGLPEDDKFEFLYSIIQLMKIDDEIFNEEVLFCQSIAQKLGYGLGAVMEMYPHVHKNLVIRDEKLKLKRKVSQFLE